MDGFKDSTKTHYSKGGSVGVKGAAKVAKVMGEFKRGTLHSGSKRGPEVTSRKQAVAIALNQARKAPLRKADGGRIVLPVDPDYEDEGVMREVAPKPKKGRPVRPAAAGPVPPQTPLQAKLSQLPSERGEMPRRGPSGAGFNAEPYCGGGLATRRRGL